MSEVLLGLGCDQGMRIDSHNEALDLLEQASVFTKKVSTYYWNSALGFDSSKLFCNRVVLCQTDLQAHELLICVKHIEAEMGREESNRNEYESRPMDIDILLFDELQLDLPDLTIPHRSMLTRHFVLVPAVEIVPKMKHPVTGLQLVEHLDQIAS